MHSEESFTTFPEALIDADDERFSTPNAIFITFIFCFYASCNAEYVSIGTSLYTIVIKYDTLWPPMGEPTVEVSRSKTGFFFQAISKTSAN